MENDPIQSAVPVKKSIPPVTAGVMSFLFAILAILLNMAAYSMIAVIVGIFGVIKGNKLGKGLSIAGIVIGVLGFFIA